MANETIGKIDCGFCGSEADIRKAKTGRGKLYLMCPHCGQLWMNTQKGQDLLLEKGRFANAAGAIPAKSAEPVTEKTAQNPVNGGDVEQEEVIRVNVNEPVPETSPEPAPEPAPETSPETVTKKTGLEDWEL